jgi:hypothetical protein
MNGRISSIEEAFRAAAVRGAMVGHEALVFELPRADV